MEMTEITYKCFDCLDSETIEWEGTVNILNQNDPYEFSVRARGSLFQVILGKYEYGLFICIPNYNIGCDLPNGIINNSIRVAQCLSVAGLSLTNATSVASAFRAIRWNYGDLLPLLCKSDL